MPKMKPNGTNRNTIAVVAILVGLGLAALGYLAWQKGMPTTSEPAIAPAKVAVQPPAAPEPAPQAMPEAEPETPEAAPQPPVAAKAPCQETAERLQAFFVRLDQRQYLASRGIKGKSEDHFAKLAKKLFANPPVVVRETDDLFTVLKNSAHFFRVLGKDDLFLIKEILERESDDLETAMADFYLWTEQESQCASRPLALHLPLNGLYEYAGFFLNTLGGQSYLFRRDSRVRMLVKYYAVLIIDRANGQGLNRHGLDIRGPLRSTVEEMEVSQNLNGRDSYLDTLVALQAKYQVKYGDK